MLVQLNRLLYSRVNSSVTGKLHLEYDSYDSLIKRLTDQILPAGTLSPFVLLCISSYSIIMLLIYNTAWLYRPMTRFLYFWPSVTWSWKFLFIYLYTLFYFSYFWTASGCFESLASQDGDIVGLRESTSHSIWLCGNANQTNRVTFLHTIIF